MTTRTDPIVIPAEVFEALSPFSRAVFRYLAETHPEAVRIVQDAGQQGVPA